jgi:hypothetical protein
VKLDLMLYLVISQLSSSDGPIILEIELSRMGLADVLRDIRDGQYSTVLAVLELNPVEGICREVTYDFKDVIDRTR